MFKNFKGLLYLYVNKFYRNKKNIFRYKKSYSVEK